MSFKHTLNPSKPVAGLIQRLMGKAQCKTHWCHILKLREWCWVGKCTVVHFWISPDLVEQSNAHVQHEDFIPPQSIARAREWQRGLEGLSHISQLQRESCRNWIFNSLNPKIWIFSFSPWLKQWIALKWWGFWVLTRFTGQNCKLEHVLQQHSSSVQAHLRSSSGVTTCEMKNFLFPHTHGCVLYFQLFRCTWPSNPYFGCEFHKFLSLYSKHLHAANGWHKHSKQDLLYALYWNTIKKPLLKDIIPSVLFPRFFFLP